MTVEQFVPVTGLSMTEAACLHSRKQLAKFPEAIGLRIELKISGCSGYMYETELANEQRDSDEVFHVGDGVDIYVDKEHMKILNGTEIDFVTQGLNSTFIFRNPNATAECGCGESFSIN